MYRQTRERRTIWVSRCLLGAMICTAGLSNARALINPHYTPVDLYYQSPVILRVEIAGPDDRGEMAMAVVTAEGEVWALLRDADQGSRLGVTVALPRDTPGPISVSATDGKRNLGARLVRPGSTALLGKRNKGPIKLQWRRPSAAQNTAQVIVIKPTRFTLPDRP